MNTLITGASGVIGRVLMDGLPAKYTVTGIDKVPSAGVEVLDIGEKEKLRKVLRGVDTVIHLAWDVQEAGTSLSGPVPGNKAMGETMYALSLEQGVQRFVLASSVHVSLGHVGYRHPGIVKNHAILHATSIKIGDEVFPLGVYGASKAYLEALGKAYSAQGLQVIAVRFGNVTRDDGFGEYPFWLSHADCCQFIERCIDATNLAPYSVFFAISDNPCNPFDLFDARRQLGYAPQDKSVCPEEGLQNIVPIL